MADKTQVRLLRVNDLSSKTLAEKAVESITNNRIRQLAALRIYHQNHIKSIDEELAVLLKDDVSDINY